jgi:hypothetical protein
MSLGDVASIDGAASYDADAQPAPLSYSWTFVTLPPGSGLDNGAISNSNGAAASFSPDVEGAFVLRLAVSDGLAAAGDNVLVRAITPGTTDLSEATAVTLSNEVVVFDEINGVTTTTLDVTIENVVGITITGPLRAVFSFPSPGTSMPGASGSTVNGDPYFSILEVAGVDQLAAGESVTFGVTFVYSSAQSLSFAVTPYGTLDGMAGVTPLRHVDADYFAKSGAAKVSCAVGRATAGGPGALVDIALVVLTALGLCCFRRRA